MVGIFFDLKKISVATYVTLERAQAAVQVINSVAFGNQVLNSCIISKEIGSEAKSHELVPNERNYLSEMNCNVFIKNLPGRLRDFELRAIFAMFGIIEGANIFSDYDYDRMQGAYRFSYKGVKGNRACFVYK